MNGYNDFSLNIRYETFINRKLKQLSYYIVNFYIVLLFLIVQLPHGYAVSVLL